MKPAGILVVDDEPANLRLMVDLLRGFGHAVRVAPGGRQALKSVAVRPPQLVLLDIRMPEPDGFEVCRRLKADPATADIPVIFLSASSDQADKFRAFELGAVDYITKPFVVEEVSARVHTHLSLRALRLELEERVANRTRALRTLSAGNQAVVRATAVEPLLEKMCRAIVERGGYQAAAVHLRDGASTQVGSACSPGSCLPAAPDGVLVAMANAEYCPNMTAGRTEILLVLPLRRGAESFGVMIVHSTDRRAFEAPEDVELLAEMAGDLAYGIETLKARDAWARSLAATIEALAATLEVRDPYTAGHQRRTARLAEAIGQKMELPEAQLRGLGIAASIHDIGKVAVPVEILSRPGKLTKAEFEIIKSHPVAGYDILAGIDFPWPVARIVRQHHERLDGSGYPDGLSGEQILLEARILAVADVVEAMASHRPYRPARPLQDAIGELRAHRGQLYDPAVVDACLELIAEDHFPLENAI
ncbi:MAG: HD domain-containing phosphohydrolase [Halothiobacillaceae bacterium]